MKGDKICYNGQFAYPDALGISPTELLERFHFYQRIHTRDHRTLHTAQHIDLIDRAMSAVFGVRFDIPDDRLETEIRQVLAMNHYPKAGNVVTLRVFPESTERPGERYAVLLEPSAQLYYPQYTSWHTRMTLEIFPCEYLFMGYTTGISAQTAGFSREFAIRQGADAAVIQNMDGLLTHIDDEAVFIVRNKTVYTTPCADGANDTVMRRLIFKACRKAGINIAETGLTAADLLSCDEVFTASAQGLISISGYRNARYFNLTANRLADILNEIEP